MHGTTLLLSNMAAWLGDSGSFDFPIQNNSKTHSEGGLSVNINSDINYEPFVKSFGDFQVCSSEGKVAESAAVTSDSKLYSKDNFIDKQARTP